MLVLYVLMALIVSANSRSLTYTQSTFSGTVPSKWDLWASGVTHLRGANIWQALVIPELDGSDFKGADHVGPPYIQEDFDHLAAMGANYVNISHPGLFTEAPPYILDEKVQGNLDQLLAMIEKANMFAVIAFRTGPGRSECGFWCDETEPAYFDYFNDIIWQDQGAQDAWATMWSYTAERYRNNPIVVGYDLMVEPNANVVGSDAINKPLGIWEPDEFYESYRGTLFDWNQLYPSITNAIREVDQETPILIGGMSFSAVEWLSYLQPTGDDRTVYTVHQYAPFEYTHQLPIETGLSYPGQFDIDGDGVVERFNQTWLEELLSTVKEFMTTHGAPVAANEFGINRWVPGGAAYMNDLMELFEQQGVNHALWLWQTSWPPFVEEVHDMNFRFGLDPNNRTDVGSSALINVITQYWNRNTVRPSNVLWAMDQ